MSRRTRSLGALAGGLLLLALPAFAEPAPPYLYGPPTSPTIVRVGFHLTDISDVDEREESVEMEGELSLRWHDPRMAFDADEASPSPKIYQGNFQFSELFDGWWPQLVLANGERAVESGSVLLKIDPDGSMTYVEKFTGRIETPMALQRFPFDEQRLAARFEVFGFARDEVQLEVDPSRTGRSSEHVIVAGWSLLGVEARVEDDDRTEQDGRTETLHQLVVTLDVRRRSGFVVVTILIPMTLLVMLTWSVFWMHDDSISDRLNITFIGILSVVAYQIIVHDLLPTISYFTLMDGFLTITLFGMALGVVVNLTIDRMNRSGRRVLGNRIDSVCRWAFPLGFLAANALVYVLV
jgi:hypothetical protein